MSPLVRRRLVDDNAITPLGRCCEGGDSQLRINSDLLDQIEQAIVELAGKGRPIDRYPHNRTLFRLDTDRLDEISGQLQWQEPRFSACRDHAGQLNLDSSENEGRPPDFNWDQF